MFEYSNAPTRETAIAWWENYFVNNGWEWNSNVEQALKIIYSNIPGRKRPYGAVMRAVSLAIDNGDSPTNFYHYFSEVRNFVVDGYYADLSSAKEDLNAFLRRVKMLRVVPVNVEQVIQSEAKATAQTTVSLLYRMWASHPDDLVTVYLYTKAIGSTITEYLSSGVPEEMERRRNALNKQMERIAKEDETLRRMLIYTGMMVDNTVNMSFGAFERFYKDYEAVVTAVHTLNDKVKDYITTNPGMDSKGFWSDDAVNAAKNVLEMNARIVEHVIGMMYGNEGQLLNTLFNDVVYKGSVYQMYRDTIDKLIAQRNSLNAMFNEFSAYKPSAYNILLSSQYAVAVPGETEGLMYDRWDICTMTLVVNAHSKSTVLKNVSDSEFAQFVSIVENSPRYTAGYLFAKEGIGFIEDAWLKITDETDRTQVFSRVVQHISTIYGVSTDYELLKKYIDGIGMTTRGTMLEELRRQTLASTARGEIDILSPHERLIAMTGMPELYESVLSQWNRFLINLNLYESNAYNYNEVQRFIGTAGLSVYFPEPNFGDPDLRFAVGIDRLLMNIDKTFRSIIEGIEMPMPDRYDVYFPFYLEPGARDIEFRTIVAGPRGTGEIAIYNDEYWDRIDSEGRIIEKTLARSVTSHTTNMYVYGLLLYEAFVDWHSKVHKDEELSMEETDNQFNARLNAMSNGSNIVFIGYVDRSEKTIADEIAYDKGSVNMDMYVLRKGRWYRVMFDKEFIEELSKKRFFAEMIRDINSIPIMAGAEVTGASVEDYSHNDVGFYIGLEAPQGTVEKTKEGLGNRAAGLVARAKGEEMAFAFSVLNPAEENIKMHSFSLMFINRADVKAYEEMLPGDVTPETIDTNIAFKYEMLILDKMRSIIFYNSNDRFALGAGLEKRDWMMGALWNFSINGDYADAYLTAGVRNVQVRNIRTNARAFYRYEEGKKGSGIIARVYIDGHRWINIYGRGVEGASAVLGIKSAEDIADALEEITTGFENDYETILTDEAARRTLLKSYGQRLGAVFSSLCSYAPWIFSEGVQFVGIGYVDTRKDINTKLTFSYAPGASDEERLCAVGMFDIKGYSIMLGMPLKKSELGGDSGEVLGRALDFIGGRITNGNWSLAIWSGNTFFTREKTEKLWGVEFAGRVMGKTLGGITLTKFEPSNWIMEGYMGNLAGFRIGIDYTKFNNLTMYGISASAQITSALHARAVLSYGSVSSRNVAGDAAETLKQWMLTSEMRWNVKDNLQFSTSIDITKTSVGMADHLVVEGNLRLSGPLPISLH